MSLLWRQPIRGGCDDAWTVPRCFYDAVLSVTACVSGNSWTYTAGANLMITGWEAPHTDEAPGVEPEDDESPVPEKL